MLRLPKHVMPLILRDIERTIPNRALGPVLRSFGAASTPFTPAYRQRQCIFIRIPKTASTSLSDALGLGPVGHIPLKRFYAYDAKAAAAYFKFCVVRNPWDRLRSAFRYLHGTTGANRDSALIAQFMDHAWADAHLAGYKSFESFVLALRDPATRRTVLRYHHFAPQLSWITLGDRIEMDFIGRFEAIGEAYAAIARRLDVPSLAELPSRRAQNLGGFRGDYTDQMVSIVADIYAEDIAALGYGFEADP